MNPDPGSITWLLGGALQPYVDWAKGVLAMVLAMAVVFGAAWICDAVAERWASKGQC